mmetsp:Transcript_1351/g.1422  ORF Transcript_1351/g.1422 Transcript_1351/m.1422 type:complete len:143 (+) Transcript_1351:49-477(+)
MVRSFLEGYEKDRKSRIAHDLQKNSHPSNFCEECGTLLSLSSRNDNITCDACGYEANFSKLNKRKKTISKVFDRKTWTTTYKQEKQKRMGETKRAIISEKCPNPKCKSKKMYFYTMQLRSADEGATVFYECVKCGHKHSVNN